MEFGGIPIVIDPAMPADEIWQVHQGKTLRLHFREGPRAGEDVEIWLRKPRIVRIVNLGPTIFEKQTP